MSSKNLIKKQNGMREFFPQKTIPQKWKKNKQQNGLWDDLVVKGFSILPLGKSYGRLGTSWGYSLSWEFKVPPPKAFLGAHFFWGGWGLALGGFPEIPMTLTIPMFFFLEPFGWYWPDGQWITWITRHDPIAVLSPFPQLAPWKIIPERGPTKLLLSHLRVICIYIFIYIYHTYIYIFMCVFIIYIIHFSGYVTSKVHHPMEEGSAKGAPLACFILWFDHLFASFRFSPLKASLTRKFVEKRRSLDVLAPPFVLAIWMILKVLQYLIFGLNVHLRKLTWNPNMIMFLRWDSFSLDDFQVPAINFQE